MPNVACSQMTIELVTVMESAAATFANYSLRTKSCAGKPGKNDTE